MEDEEEVDSCLCMRIWRVSETWEEEKYVHFPNGRVVLGEKGEIMGLPPMLIMYDDDDDEIFFSPA